MKKQMVLSRSKLRESANEGVIRNLRECVLLNLICLFFSGCIPFLVSLFLTSLIPVVGSILYWILLLPYCLFVLNLLDMGRMIAALRIAKGTSLAVGDLFEAFSDYGHCCFGMFWYYFRVFLWGFVPVIGIMKAYSYALTPYLLYTNPELSAEDAIQRSVDLMHGHRMELMILNFSFTGWYLLNVFSAGILGVLYVDMYQQTALAHAFLEIEAGFDGLDSRGVIRRSHREERRAHIRTEPSVRCSYCGAEYTSSLSVCPKCSSRRSAPVSDSPSPAPIIKGETNGFHPPKKL